MVKVETLFELLWETLLDRNKNQFLSVVSENRSEAANRIAYFMLFFLNHDQIEDLAWICTTLGENGHHDIVTLMFHLSTDLQHNIQIASEKSEMLRLVTKLYVSEYKK